MTADADIARYGKRIVARTFIVGCARSGTTLLQALVAAHPRVRSFPESHFFSWVGRSDVVTAAARLSRFVDRAGLTPPWEDVATIESREQLVVAFIDLLDRATVETGCDAWVEKTPHHVHYIPQIEEALPDAKFLHILRNAPDTITSLHRVTREHPDAWRGRRSIHRCTHRWMRDIRISLECLDRPDHHLLRYESLTTGPETVLREVCRFMCLPYTFQMISDHQAAADAVVQPHETWKRKARGEIRPAPWPATDIPALKLDDALETRLATVQRELDEKLPTRCSE